MKGKYHSILILLFLTGSACKEIYYPQLDTANAGLVVQGMITDLNEPYYIKLYKPIPYNGGAREYIHEAKVHVEDNRGNTYNFEETIPGTYVSDPTKFVSEYGVAYTMIIQTKDGKAYRSSSQTLNLKGSTDSIHAVVTNQTMTVYSNGLGAHIQNVKGADFLGNIELNNDPSPFYRYSNIMIAEYTEKYKYYGNDTIRTHYCWVKYTPYEGLNLSERFSHSTKTQQHLGFCPLDTTFYGIQLMPIFKGGPGGIAIIGYIKRIPELYMITFKQYHLNEDIYNYYKAVDAQLTARQQILDPISVQCIGNVICTTDTNEPVMGVFEVTSVNSYSYTYTRELNGTVDLLQNESFDATKLPDSDCIIDNPPDFWLSF